MKRNPSPRKVKKENPSQSWQWVLGSVSCQEHMKNVSGRTWLLFSPTATVKTPLHLLIPEMCKCESFCLPMNEIEYFYQLLITDEENERERWSHLSKFIKEEGRDTEPIGMSTPELDPFQEINVVWYINNVHEGMVKPERKFCMEGFLRYKNNWECSETQYLFFGSVIMLLPETYSNILETYFLFPEKGIFL